MQAKILYEDNHLLALEKPSGLATQPTPSDENSLETQAKAMIKVRDQKKGGVFLHAIHRLDKATSGIVLFAKTQKALSRLMQAFKENSCEKEYLALVYGAPSQGILQDFLLHGDHQAHIVPPTHLGAKEAVLTITSVEPFQLQGLENISLLTIQLQTGRYHQIRAQLAHHGFPIIGDAKYGSIFSFPKGIALHHSRLSFPHPTRGEIIIIRSTPLWVK
jgi:23S rRNA pseudouridine1911/1915/1917 synthase